MVNIDTSKYKGDKSQRGLINDLNQQKNKIEFEERYFIKINKELKKVLNEIENHITKGNLSPKEAMEVARNLQKEIVDKAQGELSKEVIKELTKILKEFDVKVQYCSVMNNKKSLEELTSLVDSYIFKLKGKPLAGYYCNDGEGYSILEWNIDRITYNWYYQKNVFANAHYKRKTYGRATVNDTVFLKSGVNYTFAMLDKGKVRVTGRISSKEKDSKDYKIEYVFEITNGKIKITSFSLNRENAKKVYNCTAYVNIHLDYSIKPFSNYIPYDIAFDDKNRKCIDCSVFIREILGIEDIYEDKYHSEEEKNKESQFIRVNEDKFNISHKLFTIGFVLDVMALCLLLIGIPPLLLIPGIICNVMSLKKKW